MKKLIILIFIALFIFACTEPINESSSNNTKEEQKGIIIGNISTAESQRWIDNQNMSEWEKPIIDENNYSFLIISDTHYDTLDYYNFLEETNYIDNIDFIIINGDITQNATDEELQRYNDDLANCNRKVYGVIGNHDIYGHPNGWELWKQNFGKSASYWIIGNTLFLFVDNADEVHILEQQKDWLENIIDKFKNDGGENIILFSHCPINDIKALCLKHKINICIWGHIHRYKYKQINETEFITMNNIHIVGKCDDNDMTHIKLKISIVNGIISYTWIE